jgi:1-deoxy-D-xylulose-5-phosphate synthase
MPQILPRIQSPQDLHALSDVELQTLTQEIRDELVNVCRTRAAHFASNLGVVELTLALHLTFDFRSDRLIWDTGHQIYPQKLITGRFAQMDSIRTKGGLMGFPHPGESDYDLFMTGHAGCSVSTISGLKAADDLRGESHRKAVAVIGDGALPSGIVFEAFNNIAGMNQDCLVILNDNAMSICPRTGGLAKYLDQCRLTGLYQGSKKTIKQILRNTPIIGKPATQALEHLKDGLKATMKGSGTLFEEFGFRYFGPVDGHDLAGLRRILQDLKHQSGPLLLHVFTQKGHGVPQAEDDPVLFHTPPLLEKVEPGRQIVGLKKGGGKAYTDAASAAIHKIMADDTRVTVMTAAMCQGNKLEKIRADYPTRFFDVGICESHAVAFAAGMAKAGLRPIVDIYSTFLQRSFDQIFQEAALQNLPVTFAMDRAGLAGPDGPTHHGCFDVPYMRLFPNIVCMAPGDEADVEPMFRLAVNHTGPTAIRYPKAPLEMATRPGGRVAPVEIGKAEIVEWGDDGAFLAFGAMLPACQKAAKILRDEDGLHVAVINARFVKPLDTETIFKVVERCPVIVTVEEGTLEGGFGSAVLEACNRAGLDTRPIVCRGIPDRFIEHGERNELLADIMLDPESLADAIRARVKGSKSSSRELATAQ